jgi:hypothetical protein
LGIHVPELQPDRVRFKIDTSKEAPSDDAKVHILLEFFMGVNPLGN